MTNQNDNQNLYEPNYPSETQVLKDCSQILGREITAEEYETDEAQWEIYKKMFESEWE